MTSALRTSDAVGDLYLNKTTIIGWRTMKFDKLRQILESFEIPVRLLEIYEPDHVAVLVDLSLKPLAMLDVNEADDSFFLVPYEGMQQDRNMQRVYQAIEVVGINVVHDFEMH